MQEGKAGINFGMLAKKGRRKFHSDANEEIELPNVGPNPGWCWDPVSLRHSNRNR